MLSSLYANQVSSYKMYVFCLQKQSDFVRHAVNAGTLKDKLSIEFQGKKISSSETIVAM